METLLQPLEEFKTDDLPEKRRSNWRLAGPGATLVGLSIGAGEIIVWPRIVAEYGASMIWAAVLGVFLQLWINLEIGRWTIATGETIYAGFSRVWRGFAPLFIIFNVVGWIAPGWGRASGLALKALLVGPGGWGSDTFWTAVTFAGVTLVLFGPKLVYKSVERTIEILVVVITVGLIVVALAVGTTDTWKEIGSGLVNFGHVATEGKRLATVSEDFQHELDDGLLTDAITRECVSQGIDLTQQPTLNVVEKGRRWIIHVGRKSYVAVKGEAAIHIHSPGMNIKALFIAIVFAGAGGTANLFYTFYLRDKNIGMGARIPEMQNPLRSRAEKIPAAGFRFLDTTKNRIRFRAWWGYLLHDQWIFFFALNLVTMLLFIFGALSVLHPIGKVPAEGQLIWDEAQVLAEAWGPVGRTVFLLVGLATLFSTQLAILDGVSRSMPISCTRIFEQHAHVT